MESLLLSLLLAAAAAASAVSASITISKRSAESKQIDDKTILCGEVVEEPVCVGRPLLLPLGDHVRQRRGSVLRMDGMHLININRLGYNPLKG